MLARRVLGTLTRVSLAKVNPPVVQAVASFARISRPSMRRPLARTEEAAPQAVAPPPPVPVDPKDAWVEVVHEPTKQIYYWNTLTNETTALGAPRPDGPTALAQAPQQQPSMMRSLGGVVAEGFAFGAGSAVAHNIVGSMFGGGHSSSSSGSSGYDSDDDDTFEV